MGVYSDVIGRYLTAKWIELVIMLFLWSVALIFYLHLEHPRIVKARNQRDRSKKNGSLRVAQKRLTRERRYCAFYVSLFALILGGCLWTYLTDMIPALRDRNNGAYTEYTGEIACDDRLGGLIASVRITGQDGTVRYLTLPVSVRSRLIGKEKLPAAARGTVAYGAESGVIVGISFPSD